MLLFIIVVVIVTSQAIFCSTEFFIVDNTQHFVPLN